MRTIYPGHLYELAHLDDNGFELLQFVQRKPLHEPVAGTTNQEVLRALIDRLIVLDSEKPWGGNTSMITWLRRCILLHEVRAYYYHVRKNGRGISTPTATMEVMAWTNHAYPDVPYEKIPTGSNGHWQILEVTHDKKEKGKAGDGNRN